LWQKNAPQHDSKCGAFAAKSIGLVVANIFRRSGVTGNLPGYQSLWTHSAGNELQRIIGRRVKGEIHLRLKPRDH
jgi:hypothetical protein